METFKQNQVKEISEQIWNMECMQAYDKVEYEKLIASDKTAELNKEITERDGEIKKINEGIAELKKSKKAADRVEIKKQELRIQTLEWEKSQLELGKRGIADLIAKHINEAVARAERIGRLKDMLSFTEKFEVGVLWNPDYVLKEGIRYEKENGRIKLNKFGQGIIYIESNGSGGKKD